MLSSKGTPISDRIGRSYQHQWYVLLSLLLMIGTYSLFLLEESVLSPLTNEDAFFESLGALGFLGASFLNLWQYCQSRRGNDLFFIRTRKNLFFLVLGLLFLVACGEEISWGQRILQFEVPESVKKYNMQDEMNLHNLLIFWSEEGKAESGWFAPIGLGGDRIFHLFWLCYCIMVPLGNRGSARIRSVLDRMNIPIVPLSIGVFFMLNYLLSRLIEEFVPWHLLRSSVEIKEFNIAILFFLTSLYSYSKMNQGSEQ